MRSSPLLLLYLVVGVLVAAGVVGSEGSYFSGLSNLEEFAEMLLAVLLWPLILLGVDVNIGDINLGGGDSGGGDSGGGGSGGGGGGGAGGGEGGSGGGGAGGADGGGGDK